MAQTLLWIGLGNIGRGMCKNIAEKSKLDKPLLIYNRTTKRATELSQSLPAGKTQVVEALGDAIAQADIIFTCVANDQAVEEIFATASQQKLEGKVFVECSTIAPGASEAAAKAVLDKGAEFICAPVFGAPAMVAAGNATLVLAGPKASIEKIRPYIDAMAAREINMADEPYHKASTLKVLGNTVILGMVEQLAETYVAAEKSGLGTGYVKQFVDAMFGGSPYPAYSVRMLEGDYYKREEPLFAVDLARKDAGHAMAIAKAAGTRLPNIENADRHLQIVKEHVGPSGDMAGIYGALPAGALRRQLHPQLTSRTSYLAQPSQRRQKQSTKQHDDINAKPDIPAHPPKSYPLPNQAAKMAQGYSIFVGLVIVVAMGAGAWFLSPKGDTQIIWRSSLLLALACCYLMWAITFLAQLHPLIEPKRSNLRESAVHH
ncbi:uncharacterized protein CCOS01_11783 [Colletotrichum costaricense]|uniref:6-phosphogluconate dehydrogenase 2 n=1 Tax=Colletotrichum costaricense TaxID=1209916 RepID=A0AAI9YQK1_9PEZI|nr:uncharacterized protein CCOS01_11783 [Colletotrichum costaricense]KAK1518963.1 hypothetical protein CCOS01_11783 [Colletotrichum costaricense]